MKNILATVLALMMLFALVSCGSEDFTTHDSTHSHTDSTTNSSITVSTTISDSASPSATTNPIISGNTTNTTEATQTPTTRPTTIPTFTSTQPSTSVVIITSSHSEVSSTNCTHSWGQWKYDNGSETANTCTENVYKSRSCKSCGAIEKLVQYPTGHFWSSATCTEPETCYWCGEVEGAAFGHNWSSATCIQPKICNRCGEVSGVALGHNWLNATCTKPETCNRCGAVGGVTTGHFWLNATCTKPKTCYWCGEVSGTAFGHNWSSATCTEPKTCNRCGEVSEAALGHNWSSATCVQPKICKLCGAISGVALGHNWEFSCVYDQCTRCGLDKAGTKPHQWVAATCTSNGYCSECGKINPNDYKLGHDFRNYEKDQNGYYYPCTRCNITYCEYRNTHWWLDATCVTPKKCYVCGKTEGRVSDNHSYHNNKCSRCGAFDSESSNLARSILNQIIKSGMNDWEKALAIHDYLCENITYDYDNYLNDTIPQESYGVLGALKNKTAVCSGYALSFELMCELAGLECNYVSGTSVNSSGVFGRHAWNQVKINGKWYNVDVTWDDPVLTNPVGKEKYKRYDYFLISDSRLYKNHTAENALHICSEDLNVIKICNSCGKFLPITQSSCDCGCTVFRNYLA